MNKIKGLGTLSFIVAAIVSIILVISQRQAIYDWARLRNYVPPAEITALANTTTMNDTGKHLFYVNRPALQNKQTFNQSCTDSEQSIVLGCYVQNRGIYLYDVTDERLKGVEEVTAAHEMLHAAYDRLSDSERMRIDQLTKQVYESTPNERIKKTVKAYDEKDSSVVPNELHSIIGTEIREIPKELEQYYKKYFNNRLAIVSLSENYEKEFEKRETLASQYKQQLESLRARVDSSNKDLAIRADQLSSEFKQLERSRSTQDASQFNVAARSYNLKVSTYNADVETVSKLIDEHNTILESYNSVVLEENELLKAIDSRPATINK